MRNDEAHELLARWRAGDERALNELLPATYAELRRVARKHLRGQRADHTLQTTALLHEAYLRLLGDGAGKHVQDIVHFMSLASRIMRQVLVDHARAQLASKRHGGLRVSLNDVEDVPHTELDVIAIDEALIDLAQLDAQQAQVVELRYFGGLSIQETAQALGVSAATVKRDWTMARLWLSTELQLGSK